MVCRSRFLCGLLWGLMLGIRAVAGEGGCLKCFILGFVVECGTMQPQALYGKSSDKLGLSS
jgi:hypothetical protein